MDTPAQTGPGSLTRARSIALRARDASSSAPPVVNVRGSVAARAWRWPSVAIRYARAEGPAASPRAAPAPPPRWRARRPPRGRDWSLPVGRDPACDTRRSKEEVSARCQRRSDASQPSFRSVRDPARRQHGGRRPLHRLLL